MISAQQGLSRVRVMVMQAWAKIDLEEILLCQGNKITIRTEYYEIE